MRREITRALLPLLFLAIAVVGCDTGGPTLPSTTPGGGFVFETRVQENSFPPFLEGGVEVNLEWVRDLLGAQGNAATLSVTSDGATALAAYTNGRSPANWNFLWVLGGPPECSGINIDANIDSTHVYAFTCILTNLPGVTAQVTASSFQFSPNPLDTSNPPGTVTITGQGFSAQYGLPLLQYFDLNGNLVAQSNVQSVAPDGTSIQAVTPDLSGISAGTYVGFIKNANSTGGWDLVGTVALTVLTPAPPPPPPPDPCPPNKPCPVQNPQN